MYLCTHTCTYILHDGVPSGMCAIRRIPVIELPNRLILFSSAVPFQFVLIVFDLSVSYLDKRQINTLIH